MPVRRAGGTAPGSDQSDLVRALRVNARLQLQFDRTFTVEEHYDAAATTGKRTEIWQREKTLGGGSFGVVHLEKCSTGKSQGQFRAIKIIQKPPVIRPGAFDAEKELQALALFSQPRYRDFFVMATGWFDTGNSIIIAMNYHDKGDLSKHITSALPEQECQRIISQVLRGIEFMHSFDITHRDLKPQNLLVASPAPRWWVKIADFGISKRVREHGTSLRTQAGTPAYMAPEVLGILEDSSDDDDNGSSDDDTSDHASENRPSRPSYTNAVDIWAIGVICLLLLTGELMFTEHKKITRYVKGKLRLPLAKFERNGVGENAIEFTHSLLCAQPSQRPSAATALQHVWFPLPVEETAHSILYEPQSKEGAAYPTVYEPQFEEIASARWTTKSGDSGYDSNTLPTIRQNLGDLVLRDIPTISNSTSRDDFWSTDITQQGLNLRLMKIAFKQPLGREWKLIKRLRYPGRRPTWQEQVVVCVTKSSVIAIATEPRSTDRAWIWDQTWPQGRQVNVNRRHDSTDRDPSQFRFSSNGKLVVQVGPEDGNLLIVRELPSMAERATIRYPQAAIPLEVSNEGQILVLMSANWDHFYLWSMESFKELADLRTDRSCFEARAFSHDSRYFACCRPSAEEVFQLVIWDIVFERITKHVPGNTYAPNSVAFSPDGKLLAWGSNEPRVCLPSPYTGVIYLWNLERSQCIERVDMDYMMLLRYLVFSPTEQQDIIVEFTSVGDSSALSRGTVYGRALLHNGRTVYTDAGTHAVLVAGGSRMKFLPDGRVVTHVKDSRGISIYALDRGTLTRSAWT